MQMQSELEGWHKAWAWRWSLAAAALVLSVALMVRLLGIASRPIWYDEAFAVLFAEKGPGAMLVGTLAPTPAGASDVHPLAYYTLLWMWIKVFGESLISVRMLSVLAGLCTVLVVFRLAVEMFDLRTGLAAGLLAALAPFQVHYSQEIRMYALMALWLVLATYCYWRGTHSHLRAWWIGLAVSAALAQYTHNLSAFHLVALALWPVLTGNWRAAKNVALAGGLALLLYIPWLVEFPAQFAKIDHAYWIEKPGLYRLLSLVLVYITNLPVGPTLLGIALFAALSVTFLALMRLWRFPRQHDPSRQSGGWLFYLAFSGPILAFAFSWWKPIYLERAFLPAGALFSVGLAWAFWYRNPSRATRTIALVLLAAGYGVGLYEHLSYRGFPYAPYKQLATSLHSQVRVDDVIVHSNKISFLPLVYYDRTLPGRYIADVPRSGADTLAPATQAILGLYADGGIAAAVNNARRVWFIMFSQSNEEFVRAGYPMHPDLAWLKAHYAQSDVQHWDDLDLYLFSKSP